MKIDEKTIDDILENKLEDMSVEEKVELLKVPTIIEMTQNFLKEGLSVAIFVNFNATLEALRERLSLEKYGIGILSGNHLKDRQKNIEDFAADRIRIILCNVAAGGVGVNLHDTNGKHPRVSILNPTDAAKTCLQALGRIHRAGGATPTRQYILFANNTIECIVKDNMDKKIQNLSIFNEGLNETS